MEPVVGAKDATLPYRNQEGHHRGHHKKPRHSPHKGHNRSQAVWQNNHPLSGGRASDLSGSTGKGHHLPEL